MPESAPKLSPAELSRYSRHILLDEIGLDGQQRLAAARVLIIGAGGLGSPAALYLAAAGIGHLGIADLDVVEEHNLQRQLLHDTSSIGLPKVASAAARLVAINPYIKVTTHPEGITPENAAGIFAQYDVIVDGTDNFTSRYLNNDAAFFAKKPLVFGSVFKFEGQVAVFHPSHEGPCYRCLFPEPPLPGSVPGCGEAGVLGALCGVIGSLQALEAVKLVLGIGESLQGRLLTYNGLTHTFHTFSLKRSPTCALCGDVPALHAPAGGRSPEKRTANTHQSKRGVPLELSVSEAKGLLDRNSSSVLVIDVREPWEVEICRIQPSQTIPMRQIPERLAGLPKDKHLLILCHHGARSMNVTNFLRSRGFESVSNIAGGVAAWAADLDPTMARY